MGDIDMSSIEKPKMLTMDCGYNYRNDLQSPCMRSELQSPSISTAACCSLYREMCAGLFGTNRGTLPYDAAVDLWNVAQEMLLGFGR